MNATEIVSVAVATLIVLVLAHLAVYWVVRTLYPPTTQVPVQVPVQVQEPEKTVTFAEPPSVVQQNVTVPTYETPVPVQAPSEAGDRRGPPPAESTSIRGNSRVATSDAQ